MGGTQGRRVTGGEAPSAFLARCHFETKGNPFIYLPKKILLLLHTHLFYKFESSICISAFIISTLVDMNTILLTNKCSEKNC